DGDEKNEQLLLIQEIPVGPRGDLEKRRLREVRHHVDLNAADDGRDPGDEHQVEERALLHQPAQALRADDHPRAAMNVGAAVAPPVSLAVNGHYTGLSCSPTAPANTSSSVGRLGLR